MEKRKIIFTFLPAIELAIIFIFQSIINHSLTFSIELAIFSFFVTTSFEINEWCIFYDKENGKLTNFFNVIPPILFIIIMMEIFSFIYNGIDKLIDIKISTENASVLSNIITSITLFGYFLSYGIRSIAKQKQNYLDKK